MTMTKPTSEQVTFTAAGSGTTLRNLVDKVREVVSVKDFGAVGDGVADDTFAVQACVDAAKNGTNKTIRIPAGTYLVSHIDMIGLAYSNLTFIGEGQPTFKFKLPPGGRVLIPGYASPTFARSNLADGIFVLDANVAAQYTNDALSIKNVTFIGITFLMDVVADGFDELMHGVCAHGTSGLYFDHCQFIGFMGDGIAVCRGRGFDPVLNITWPSFAYNANTVVTNCIFDGVNKDNRQAISIYYCDGFTIMDNVFKNTTRAGMPGAIDLESDSDSTTTRCGLITRNTFDNIGSAGIRILPRLNATVPMRQIEVSYNVFTNITGGSWVATVFSPPGQLPNTKSCNFLFSHNQCVNVGSAFVVRQLDGVIIRNNTFKNATTTGVYQVENCNNTQLIENDFDAVAATPVSPNLAGLGITSTGNNRVDVIGNRFYNMGWTAMYVSKGGIGLVADNEFISSTNANPWCVFSASGTVGEWEPTTFANNHLAGTFATGSNGAQSVNKLLWIQGGIIPSSWAQPGATPGAFDYGTTVFESVGSWPEPANDPGAGNRNGTLVTTRLKDATSISVTQYFYPSYNDTALPVYYRHAASNTTWQNWRKFSQTVL